MSNEHVYEPYGELYYCKTCMGLEGSMPTDCPGSKMTTEQSDRVYAGNLDFRKDEGWVNKLSPMGKSMIMSKLFGMWQEREGCCTSETEIILQIGTTREEFNKVKKQCVKHIYR